MADANDRVLHRAVGLSDMAALLAAAFSFPTGELVAALADGAFVADWRVSVADACDDGCPGDVELATRVTDACAEGPCDEEVLCREYSRLFLAPGTNVPVWPYESCFRHRAAGAPGTPSLFRTRAALDVERRMHEAGVAPVDEHREPGDSVFREIEFLSLLHARCGEALRAGEADGVSADVWAERLAGFACEHALTWIPDFMGEVQDASRLGIYRALAGLGVRYFDELAVEVGAGRPASAPEVGAGIALGAASARTASKTGIALGAERR